ncbi:chitobiase/beta-hexosaminidase C-terminal domain-containing protein [Breznakiellaceae bacterium SP9]
MEKNKSTGAGSIVRIFGLIVALAAVMGLVTCKNGILKGLNDDDADVKTEYVPSPYPVPGGSNTAATPTADLATGNYTFPQSVTLSCLTTGATIHYTIDGSVPTASSTQYTSSIPIQIDGPATLMAIAVKSGMVNSAVMVHYYTTPGVTPGTPLPTLVAYPPGGEYPHSDYPTISGFPISVTLSGIAPGSNVYYIVGTETPDPGPGVSGVVSVPNSTGSPIVIPTSITVGQVVKAIATKAGYANSNIMRAAYTKPKVAPIKVKVTSGALPQPSGPDADDFPYVTNGGHFGKKMTVELETDTPTVTIYFTIDGTTPTTSSPTTTSSSNYPIVLDVGPSVTIKAFATRSDLDPSNLLTAEYTVHGIRTSAGTQPTIKYPTPDKLSIYPSMYGSSYRWYREGLPIDGAAGAGSEYQLNFKEDWEKKFSVLVNGDFTVAWEDTIPYVSQNDGVSVRNESQLSNALNTTTNIKRIYIEQDIFLNNTVSTTANNKVVFIGLGNDRKINTGSSNITITGATLELYNITITGNPTNNYLIAAGSAGLNLVMGNDAKVTGNTSGGGVSLNGASLTMSGNSEISGNTRTGGGAGVLIQNNGSLTMSEDATIYGNTTSGNGGGVFLRSGTFTMNNGGIYGNHANSAAGKGGGVYLESNGIFTKNGGYIYGNAASTPVNKRNTAFEGAAVYNASGTYSGVGSSGPAYESQQ